MGVVIDTCVWVDIERGHLKPAQVTARIGDAPVYLTPTVIAELQYGVERAPSTKQKTLRQEATERLKNKPCLQIDENTATLFGSLCAKLDNRGTPSTHRVHDLWIAASTIQHGFSLLTRNAGDFQDIPSLDLMII